MKKTIVLFLALAMALCLPALAEGGVTLTPAGNFSSYAAFEDARARIIDTDEDYLEGVFDIQGNAIIPCAYGSISEDYSGSGYYIVQNENGVNTQGALNAAGEEVVPMAYGDIEFLSEKYAMAVKLEETDGADYDYEAFFGDGHYIVTAYDFYDLEAGALVGTMAREQVNSAKAYGDYIFVEDHDGVVTVYDATFTAVGNAESIYEAYTDDASGVISLGSGDVIVPGYSFGSDLGSGRISIYDDDYNAGVADLEGNIIVPCEYDTVYAYGANGYARVQKDGKYGLTDWEGNLVVPCEYDGIESLSFGGGYAYGLNGYACVELGGKYGYVSLETGEITCPATYASPTIIGLSMIVPDISGELYIVAADGTVTPTTYAEFNKYPGGDGTLLIAKTAEEKWGLIDWHGNVVVDFTYDYSYSIEIAPDGTAVLLETEDGYTGYTVGSAVGTPAASEVTAQPEAAGEAVDDGEIPDDATAGGLLGSMQDLLGIF